ncbi:MAG TPA: cytochrome c3 family protein [Polyangiaceae bacterium]|jgi:hypothetical protein
MPEEHDAREHPSGLFPSWATPALRALLFSCVCLVLLVPTLLWAWQRTPYVTDELDPKVQPVKFDHRHHVHDDGISCAYCHADAFRSANAGMPAVSVCMGCHAQIWGHSPELEPVRNAYFSGARLEWQRVTRVPDFVFFDHSVHTNNGVACTSCHGRVDQMAQVYSVEAFNMDFCLDCHRHPAGRVRPVEHVLDPDWRPPSGRALEHTPEVQPRTDCTTCHR